MCNYNLSYWINRFAHADIGICHWAKSVVVTIPLITMTSKIKFGHLNFFFKYQKGKITLRSIVALCMKFPWGEKTVVGGFEGTPVRLD